MTPEDRDDVAELSDAYLRELRDARLAYRPAEAARLLGIDERTMYRLIQSGHVYARKVSARLTLVPRAALFEFLGLTDEPQPLTGVTAPQEVVSR